MALQQDYLLRMIEQAFAALRRLLGRQREGDPRGALVDLDSSVAELLGPAAAVAERLDPATAAQLVRDPERVALWARLLAERAEILRSASDPDAGKWGRRALAIALEGWLLEDEQRRLGADLRAVLGEAVAMGRGWIDEGELDERYRSALAAATASLPAPEG
ncbi:MAG TPA: hypothetical protein VE913_24200 [Longimicrobium sp.]|nr:hypothetical protein [Longimicrobium sp.]